MFLPEHIYIFIQLLLHLCLVLTCYGLYFFTLLRQAVDFFDEVALLFAEFGLRAFEVLGQLLGLFLQPHDLFLELSVGIAQLDDLLVINGFQFFMVCPHFCLFTFMEGGGVFKFFFEHVLVRCLCFECSDHGLVHLSEVPLSIFGVLQLQLHQFHLLREDSDVLLALTLLFTSFSPHFFHDGAALLARFWRF